MPTIAVRTGFWFLRVTGLMNRSGRDDASLRRKIAKVRAKPVPTPSARLRGRISVCTEQFEGHAVWHLEPSAPTQTTPTLLYFHGGAYLYPVQSVHWQFLGHLVEKFAMRIIVPMYPLAPESTPTEIMTFGVNLFRNLSERYGASNLVIGGDSAGGGLATAAAMLAQDGGLAQPAGLILICPWLDVVPNHPDQVAIAKRDIMLSLPGIDAAGKIFAHGEPLESVRVSPAYGGTVGLPPVLLYGGADDMLVTNARQFRDRLTAENRDVEYVEAQGMCHVWPILPFKESRQAQRQMAEFIARVCRAPLALVDG